MPQQVKTLAGFLAVYLVVPILLARFVVGANWAQILAAYGVLLALLALVAAGGQTTDEKLAWVMILGMFFTIPGIPILTAIFRTTGLLS